MSQEDSRDLEHWEKENVVMDARIPEEAKSAILNVLRERRVAAQILLEDQLPDLRSCGLIVRIVEFTVDPISEEIRAKMRRKGIPLPENDQDGGKCYLYFIGKHEALVMLLERAFYRGDYKLIEDILTAEVPKNSHEH